LGGYLGLLTVLREMLTFLPIVASERQAGHDVGMLDTLEQVKTGQAGGRESQ
jgi:hypothetical protein